MSGEFELSVVMPAFNEMHRIGASLERVTTWAASRAAPVEVVVVDDGSRDSTPEVVGMFAPRGVRLIRLPANRGKGAALAAGVAASSGATVLVSDADLSTPIEEVDRLMPMLRDAELILGSRAVAGARITRHQPALRELSGRMFNLAIATLGVRGVRDTQCGFKLLAGGAARRLFARLTVERFAFDVELVWLARRLGYRVLEVGVEWQNDPATRVRVVRDGLRMLVDVARFRFRHRGLTAGGTAERGSE